MSVQSEITRIQNAVQGAIAAIEDKGVSVSEDAGVDDLAALIASIICPDVSKVTAAAGNVLEGKVFVDANGNAVTGTMTNQGAVSTTVEAGGTYTIPAGYHNGSGKVTGAASAGYKVLTGTKTPASGATSLSISHSLGKTPVGAFLILGSTYTMPTTSGAMTVLTQYSGSSVGFGATKNSTGTVFAKAVSTTSINSSNVTFSAKNTGGSVMNYIPYAYYYVIWG